MKQFMAMLMMAILLFGFVPHMVLAEEQEETADDDSVAESETEVEVESIVNGKGAEMRLLQLEKALTRAKLHGEEIIAALNEKGADTAALSDIVAEFDAMIIQIQAASENADNTEEAVKAFVSIKSDARELVKEFHDAASPLLTDAEKERLRAERRNAEDGDAVKALNNKIENTRREFNAERVKARFSEAGVDVDERLMERIRLGKANGEEVRSEMKERVRGVSEEKRAEAIARMKEDSARCRVQALASLDRAEENLGSRAERLQERIRISQERGNEGVAARLGMVSERFGEQAGRMSEVRARIESQGSGSTNEGSRGNGR